MSSPDRGPRRDGVSPADLNATLNTTLQSIHTDVDCPFRFQTPYQPINWRRVAGTSLEDLKEQGDTVGLLMHERDVLYGDTRGDAIVADSRLKRAMLLAQYTGQYLKFCNETLSTSCGSLESHLAQSRRVLKAAQAEQEKHRRERHRLRAEKRQLDEQIASLDLLLMHTNPELHARVRVLKKGGLCIAPPNRVGRSTRRRRRRRKEPKDEAKGDPEPPKDDVGAAETKATNTRRVDVFTRPAVQAAPPLEFQGGPAMQRPTGVPPSSAHAHPPPTTRPPDRPLTAQERDLARSLTTDRSLGPGAMPRGGHRTPSPPRRRGMHRVSSSPPSAMAAAASAAAATSPRRGRGASPGRRRTSPLGRRTGSPGLRRVGSAFPLTP